jgi:hypothetical protein
VSNTYPQETGAAGGNGSSGHRRERDARGHSPNIFNGTSTQPTGNVGRNYNGSFDFDEMLIALRELFVHDRQVASQAESRRCGICYLYFTVDELTYYEEEGFYACSSCERSLGKHRLPMIRQQQK